MNVVALSPLLRYYEITKFLGLGLSTSPFALNNRFPKPSQGSVTPIVPVPEFA